MKKNHCCQQMNCIVNVVKHVNAVVSYSEVFDEYGICIHDGGSSNITINFCPWCGKKLPESQRQRWFDELEKLGYFSPLFDDTIPSKFKSSKWRE